MKKRELAFLFISILSTVTLIMVIVLERYGLTVWGKFEDLNISRTGTWGQMMSAFGTTFAFVVALTNLIFQRTQYLSGEKRREKEEETAVSVWLSFTEEVEDDGKHKVWLWDVNIQNSTKSQIYNWLIKFDNYPNHLCNVQEKPLSPDANLFNLEFLDDVEPSKAPKAEIIFKSKADNFWSKTSDGILKEVTVKEIQCEHQMIKP